MSPSVRWGPPRRTERNGTIARLDPAQQSGYIRDEMEPGLVFFHRTNLDGIRFEDLAEGQRVVYLRRTEASGGRYRAQHVRPVAP